MNVCIHTVCAKTCISVYVVCVGLSVCFGLGFGRYVYDCIYVFGICMYRLCLYTEVHVWMVYVYMCACMLCECI